MPALVSLVCTHAFGPWAYSSVPCFLQRMRIPSAKATEMHWKLHGEMQVRYLGDLLLLEAVVADMEASPTVLPANVMLSPPPPLC